MYNLSSFPSDFSVYWRLFKICIIGSQRYECWIKNSAVCGCIISSFSPRFETAPCSSRTGQPLPGRGKEIFHPKPHSGGFKDSNWESLSPLDGQREEREEMCTAVLKWSAGPVLEGWNSLFTKDIAWGSLKPFLTSTFLFYPNYPGFVVYQQPAWAVSGVGGLPSLCCLCHQEYPSPALSCSTLGLWGCTLAPWAWQRWINFIPL